MGDIRQRIEGTAADFARQVDDEHAPEVAGTGPILPDDPRGDPSAVEVDVNDVEAALNPDEQFIEPSVGDDQTEWDLESVEGRAGD